MESLAEFQTVSEEAGPIRRCQSTTLIRCASADAELTTRGGSNAMPNN